MPVASAGSCSFTPSTTHATAASARRSKPRWRASWPSSAPPSTPRATACGWRAAQIEGAIAIDGANTSQHGAHLRWFITSDTLRGQGVGKQLLQRALAFADTQGYRSVGLWTFAGLDAARHLYESHGFRLVQQNPGSTWGTAVQEQRFVRERP